MATEKKAFINLKRIYTEGDRSLAFRNFPGGFERWQRKARAVLISKLALDRIKDRAEDHRPTVELGEPEACAGYTIQRGTLETEPEVLIPFWLLKPDGDGPWPLGLFPHGHDSRGHDTTAGRYHDEEHREKSLQEDRDVAVQAAKRGMVAIAPAVRGLSGYIIPDTGGRHGDRPCRSHLMHCLVIGRTAMGERIWDMRSILDWALKLPEVEGRQVLMMGNSGGGMVTLFAAACDPRIDIAVPSCSFCSTISKTGYMFHCDCNMVPGLLDLGGLSGVAGLIAPRHLLTVNGKDDQLFAQEDIERAASRVKEIYRASGYPRHYDHRWGEGGHRFYKELMWPFIQKGLQSLH